MEDERRSFPIALDRSGRSFFRFGNKCQRGYFACQTDCTKCPLESSLSMDKKCNRMDAITKNLSICKGNDKNLPFTDRHEIPQKKTDHEESLL